jgi:hypothetical protein
VKTPSPGRELRPLNMIIFLLGLIWILGVLFRLQDPETADTS